MAVLTLEVPDDATRLERGLLALVTCGGASKAAEAQCGIPAATLRDYKRRHPELYERVRERLAPQLERTVVNDCYERIIRLAAVETLAMSKLEQALAEDAVPAKDLGRTLLAVTNAKAVQVEKVLALSGRPTQIVEHRSAAELIRRLDALGAIVDGSVAEDAGETLAS